MVNQNVREYIKNNWVHTIRKPGGAVHGIVNLPYCYTTPCIDDTFVDFYYWDTYFTNIGLLECGMEEQARSNLDTMKYFVDSIGFMPNANHILDRSQPPLFTAAVYYLYECCKDKGVIEKYIDSILKELKFFQYDRMTSIGLNAYGTNATRTELEGAAGWLCARVGLEVPETVEERIRIAYNLYAIAESGWDFTPRFAAGERPFAAEEFAEIDLNCLLYDAQCKAAKMLRLVNRNEEAEELEKAAEERKKRICKYMYDPDKKIYLDYDYKEDRLSSVKSCASFYVYWAGISEEKKGAEELLKALELPRGLAACEERENADYLQWDYPAMWPSNVYFAVHGLLKIGMEEEALRIAGKYVDTVDKCFEKTGLLWEKYDAAIGEVSVSREYDTPSMMGWTAGVYLDMCRVLKLD